MKLKLQVVTPTRTVVATEAVPPGGGWEVKVTPYGWMTGINGTITARAARCRPR